MALELTRESPAPGLVVYQPARGYRYALDPFLLVGWALDAGLPARFLDVGTGSGIMALLLARLGVPGEGIDIQQEWIALAQRSAAESKLTLDLYVQDVRERREPPVELVLCNPPFWRLGSGPVSSDLMKAAARHEMNGSLAELVPALARSGERLAMVVPAARGEEAAGLLAAAGRPLRRRARVDDALVLLEGREGAELREDVVVRTRGEGGVWSAWVRACYERVGARLRGDS